MSAPLGEAWASRLDGFLHLSHTDISRITDLLTELSRTQAALEAHDRQLHDLLARIFRDGGQHVGRVGIDHACEEADKLVADIYVEVEDLTAERDRLLEALPRLAHAIRIQAEWVGILDNDGSAKRQRHHMEKLDALFA